MTQDPKRHRRTVKEKREVVISYSHRTNRQWIEIKKKRKGIELNYELYASSTAKKNLVWSYHKKYVLITIQYYKYLFYSLDRLCCPKDGSHTLDQWSDDDDDNDDYIHITLRICSTKWQNVIILLLFFN